jgi:hypothetical protein
MGSIGSGSVEFRKIAWVVLATALLAIGCASGPRLRYKHEFTLSPGQQHHAGLARALLIPIDATNDKRVAGLDIANERITALIVGHLESKGISVERVDPGEFELAAEAARETVRADRKSGGFGVVSAEIEFEDLIPAILEKLDQSADLVVAPDIGVRVAAYQGKRTIIWDGVRRRESLIESRISGDIPAASLRITVHAKDGSPVFSGYGGLEPIFRIDGSNLKYVQREDLFEDERNLREGICVAFYPYFGMDEACRG